MFLFSHRCSRHSKCTRERTARIHLLCSDPRMMRTSFTFVRFIGACARGYSIGLMHSALLEADGGEVTPLVAGAIEWYSWRQATMVATGWERTAKGAAVKGNVPWRNCSPSAPPPDTGKSSSPVREGAMSDDPCYGPFPFPKGPLLFLSAPVVRWLNTSDLVRRDVWRALELAAGRIPAYRGPGSGRIPQDVSLGFWLSHHPTLRVIDLQPFTAWCDRWRQVGDLRQLLIAHRVPWSRMAWLMESTHRLWSSPDVIAKGRLRCAGPVCEHGICASARGQRACRMEVTLPPSTSRSADFGCFACNCWSVEVEAPMAHQRIWINASCRFSRTTLPRLPEDCWRRHGTGQAF